MNVPQNVPITVVKLPPPLPKKKSMGLKAVTMAARLSWIVAILSIIYALALFKISGIYIPPAPLLTLFGITALTGGLLLVSMLGAVIYGDKKLIGQLIRGSLLQAGSVLITLSILYGIVSEGARIAQMRAQKAAEIQAEKDRIAERRALFNQHYVPPRPKSGVATSTPDFQKSDGTYLMPSTAVRVLDDYSIRPLGGPIKGEIVPEVVWSENGNYLFMLDDSFLRKIQLSDGRQTNLLSLKEGTGMALAAGGLVVTTKEAKELLVVEPKTLNLERRLNIPASRIAASPATNWMLALTPRPELINLELGYYRPLEDSRLEFIQRIAVSPDGNDYFLCGKALHQYHRNQETFLHNCSSPTVDNRRVTGHIEFSSDGKMVTLSRPTYFYLRNVGRKGNSNGSAIRWYDMATMRKEMAALVTSEQCDITVCDARSQRFYAAGIGGEVIEYDFQGVQLRTIQSGAGQIKQLKLHPDKVGLLVVGDQLVWLDLPPWSKPAPTLPAPTPPPVVVRPPVIPKPAPPPVDPTVPEQRIDNLVKVTDLTDPNSKLPRLVKIDPPILRKFSPRIFWANLHQQLYVFDVDKSHSSLSTVEMRHLSLPDFQQRMHRVIPEVKGMEDVWETSAGVVIKTRPRNAYLVNFDGLVEKDLSGQAFHHVASSPSSPYLYIVDYPIRRLDVRTNETELMSNITTESGGKLVIDSLCLSADGQKLLVRTNKKDFDSYQIQELQLTKQGSIALPYSFDATLAALGDYWLVRPNKLHLHLLSLNLDSETKILSHYENAFGLDPVTNKLYSVGKGSLNVYSLDGKLEQEFRVPVQKATQVIPHPSGRKMIVISDSLYWVELPSE